MNNAIATIDARGLICPEPIMMLHAAIRDAGEGDSIVLLTTDPAAERDVKQFCDFLGHTLLGLVHEPNHTCFTIRKGEI